jgi:hypothetical protein
VAVRSGSIESVVTLDATVVANPTYVITAAQAGRISFSARPASMSASAAEIAVITDGGASSRVFLPPFSEGPRWMVPDGALVTLGLPVASATYDGFAIAADVPEGVLYRFYGPVGDMNAEIKQGPGPFECSPIGSIGSAATPDAAAATETTSPEASTVQVSGPTVGGPVRILCASPRNLAFFAGMTAILAVTTARALNVLVLPVQAVAGSSQNGKVRLVLANGATEDREVSLGITDGSLIEIKTGLKEGDVVQVPGPFLSGGN